MKITKARIGWCIIVVLVLGWVTTWAANTFMSDLNENAAPKWALAAARSGAGTEAVRGAGGFELGGRADGRFMRGEDGDWSILLSGRLDGADVAPFEDVIVTAGADGRIYSVTYMAGKLGEARLRAVIAQLGKRYGLSEARGSTLTFGSGPRVAQVSFGRVATMLQYVDRELEAAEKARVKGLRLERKKEM